MRYLAFVALFSAVGAAQAVVVPNSLAAVEGDGAFFLTSTAAAGRTFQMTISSNQLTGLVGMTLLGICFRMNNAVTTAWPPANVTFADWDIYLGPGVAPSTMSNTFASNFSGPATQVRNGALAFSQGAFPVGASGTTPNAFGPAISFDTGYFYSGGDLTLEMRFSAQTGSSTTPSFDAAAAAGGPGNGWGVDFAARWTSNAAGTTGANGNFLVTSFHAVPEPGTLAALGIGALALLRRRRR